MSRSVLLSSGLIESPLSVRIALSYPPVAGVSPHNPLKYQSDTFQSNARELIRRPDGKGQHLRGSGLLSAMTAGDSRIMNLETDVTALPEGFPKSHYASFKDFLADSVNHKWLEEGTLVVIDRHAKSVCNSVGFLQGASESPLVSAGQTQSSVLGKTLSALPIDTIYTSPLGRSQETANGMSAGMSTRPAVVIEPNLSELNLGLLEWRPDPMTSAELDVLLKSLFDSEGRAAFKAKTGLTDAEVDLLRDASLKQRDLVRAEAVKQGLSEDELVQLMLKVLEDVDYHPPGGQSFRELMAQVSLEKRRLDGREFDGRAVALVSHGMPDRLLIMEMLGLPFKSIQELSSIPQSNAGITVLWRPKGSDKWQLLVLNGKNDGS